MEWPSQCQYWRDPQVKTFVREFALFKTVLHGCAYRLRNRKGNFTKKPWTHASTSEIVTEGLERRCGGTHEHEEARGKDCKLAEDYTDAFARQVHSVLARTPAYSEFSNSSSPHPPCAAAVSTSQRARVRPRPAPPRYGPPRLGGCLSPACGGACAAAPASLALPIPQLKPSLRLSR